MYTIQNIAAIIKAHFVKQGSNHVITELAYDTRSIQFAEKAVFFALVTKRNNGHKYLKDAYKKGVRNFVVSTTFDFSHFDNCNILLVKNTVAALQQLAQHHREKYSLPVIGITGSNGKTIVKEWLYQLMHTDYDIVRSPRSFNSQIGVPLSVWQLSENNTLALFEAGISMPGEMQALQNIIQPNIGIITNIGEAHGENFSSAEQKLKEKLLLFKNCGTIVYPADDDKIETFIQDFTKAQLIGWGKKNKSALKLEAAEKQAGHTKVTVKYRSKLINFTLPFTDDASVENALSCCCVLLFLGYNEKAIAEKMKTLHPVEMRLQLNKGINHCKIINDSYSADLTSLYNALNFLKQQAFFQKQTVILSDFVESGKSNEVLYNSIAQTLIQHGVQKVLGVGNIISIFLPSFLNKNIEQQYFASTEDFVRHFKSTDFKEETILIKGARKFGFENIVQLFEQKVHQTLLEINLNAIAHNLKEYQKLLKPGTKIMAMVKAFAYGSGGAEIAGVLQFNNVDYLGVAYADEGVDLRKAGISLPIMVMNADASSFNTLIENSLQPVIYSFDILDAFYQFLSNQGVSNYPVHIEVETGMNRLGFALKEIEALGNYLTKTNAIKVATVFSHLAASDDNAQDDFSNTQATILLKAVEQLKKYISYPFIIHISNSAAIIRLPQLQMDMVRLGIGLYGVEITATPLNILPVATLKSTIAQLKHIDKFETVSYNRRGVVSRNSVIATVRIGYADGYSRRFSNGAGKMLVKGKLAPVVGTVCMDMTMIDVTEIENVKIGDEVVVFGKDLPIAQLAKWAETIPYEIMTSVSQRVKRIYFHE